MTNFAMKASTAIRTDEVVKTLQDLISINSVNPCFGGPGEFQISEYVVEFLQKMDVPCRRQEVWPRRFNIIGEVSGSEPERIIVFEAHMDTASAEGMIVEPFTPLQKGNRMYGRGACDTKAGLAAMLHALKAVRYSGDKPRASILLAAVVDEEHAFGGVLKLVQGLSAEGAVVAEPTELMPVVASKGCLRWRIKVRGKAAHSSKPQLGVNAISKMSQIIQQIETELPPLFSSRSHPLLGSPTLNIGTITGGVQVNFVPDSCIISVDRRLVPGETRQSVYGEIENLLGRLRASDPALVAEMEAPVLEDEPLDTSPDAHIAQVALNSVRNVTGAGSFVGVPFGSDAGKLNRAGVPAVILGPGSIDKAHASDEFVEVGQVYQAAQIYRQMMVAF